MLWREGYRSRRREDWASPVPVGEVGDVVLVAGGLASLSAFGVLLRLAAGELGEESWCGLLIGSESGYREALPASVLSRCVFAPTGDLEGDRALAGVRAPIGLTAVHLAPLTEEAWEAILEARDQVR